MLPALRALCLAALVCMAAASTASTVEVVDIRALNATVDGPVMLAVLSAAGLRNVATAAAFVYTDDYDVFWLQTLLPNASTVPVSVPSFLGRATSEFGVIVYDSDPALNGTLLPSVVTMAGVLGAVPLDGALLAKFPSARVVLDTRGMWPTPEAAVQFTVAKALNATSSLAFQEGRLLASGFLADLIVRGKMRSRFVCVWLCVCVCVCAYACVCVWMCVRV